MKSITAERIREAVVCIAGEIDSRMSGRPKATASNEQELWTELTCCVLSSQVPYDLARAAAARIADAGVLRKTDWHVQRILKREICELLSTPFSLTNGSRRYRFPNIRASQIAAAFGGVREKFGSLTELLSLHTDVRCARSWLVSNLPGMGPKQASMFLRNAVGSYDLAVLDRHVIRYMRTIDLCTTDTAELRTISRYERCEAELRQHAECLGHAVGLLDWAIWIVMRTASRIEREWVS